MPAKNSYQFFDINSAEAMRTQHESIERIRLGFAQNEFILYYQSKVNMKTGAVIGAEALIRWQHPQQGILAPAAFLPIIEGHLISVALGEWVINNALQQISAWQTEGLKIPVSVNVGASQWQSHNFETNLSEASSPPDVRSDHLQLEILETSAIDDLDKVSQLMQTCINLGVSFSLDDFGTGYSSLTYLKRLPASELKIDQSFVRDMLTDTSDLAIVKAVIGLADIFNRSVIAEGVETAAHGEKLLALHCENVQGYGIARPMPANDMPLWVKRWHLKPTWTA